MSANPELCQSACASNVRILSLKAFRIGNKLVNMFKYHLINFLRQRQIAEQKQVKARLLIRRDFVY